MTTDKKLDEVIERLAGADEYEVIWGCNDHLTATKMARCLKAHHEALISAIPHPSEMAAYDASFALYNTLFQEGEVNDGE